MLGEGLDEAAQVDVDVFVAAFVQAVRVEDRGGAFGEGRLPHDTHGLQAVAADVADSDRDAVPWQVDEVLPVIARVQSADGGPVADGYPVIPDRCRDQ